MKKRNFFVKLLIMMVLFTAMTTFSFAEATEGSTDEQQSVTLTTEGQPQPRRACFERGSGVLTQISGRYVMVEGEAFGYHDVDRIGMTLYLEKESGNGSVLVTSWSVKEYNTDYAHLLKGYTVSSAGNYRLTGVFSTKHEADGGGTEGASAYSSWMWID